MSSSGCTFCLWSRQQEAIRDGISKGPTCDQWQEIYYFVAVVMMAQYTSRWREKWVTCWALGELELLQDQLTGLEEAETPFELQVSLISQT